MGKQIAVNSKVSKSISVYIIASLRSGYLRTVTVVSAAGKSKGFKEACTTIDSIKFVMQRVHLFDL